VAYPGKYVLPGVSEFELVGRSLVSSVILDRSKWLAVSHAEKDRVDAGEMKGDVYAVELVNAAVWMSR
jgi:hypothetical protein